MIIERVITVEYLEPSMSRELLRKFPDNSAFDFDYSQSGIWSPLLPRNSNLAQIAQTHFADHSNDDPSRDGPVPCFGFDQKQSGLWSPLLPRRHSTLVSVSPMELRRKLFDGLDERTQFSNKRSKRNKSKSSAFFGFDHSQSQSRPFMVSGFPLMMGWKLFDGSNVAAKIKKKMMIAAVTRKQSSSAVADVSVSPDQNKISADPKKGWGRALRAASRQFKKHRAGASLQVKLPKFLKIGEF